MGAVFVGENALTVECARLWLARGRRIAGVASEAAAVRQWARDRGIPEAHRVAELVPVRSKRPFDYLFSVAHLGMLPAGVLALPRMLPVNFHDGLLPADAGLHATAWAVSRGATTHGITWHVMMSRADAGDILAQRSFPIGPRDTSWSVTTRCFEAGLDAFGDLVERIGSGTLSRTVQDLSRRTYHPASDRPAGALILDPGDAAERIAALVHACDFGPNANGFGTAKLAAGRGLLAVASARTTHACSKEAPGTVLACEGDEATIATASNDIVLGGITTLSGQPVDLSGCGIVPGARLAPPAEARREALTTAMWEALGQERHWVERLESVRPMDLPYRRSAERPASWNPPIDLPAMGTARQAVAAVCAFLARIAPGKPGEHGGFGESGGFGGAGGFGEPGGSGALGHLGIRTAAGAEGVEDLVAQTFPLAVPAVEPGVVFADYRSAVEVELDRVTSAGGYLRDVFLRYPRLRAAGGISDEPPIVLDLGGAQAEAAPNTVVRVEISPQGGIRWRIAREALSEPDARSLVSAFATFQKELESVSLDRVPLLRPDRCVHQLVAAQAARTPGAPAVAVESETLTYQQLQQRVEGIAAGLAARGAGPGDLIGVYLRRTPDLVAALLAVLTAGAAYVPLDPVYPPERIAAMLEDAQARLLLVDADPDPAVKAAAAEVVHLRELNPEGAVTDRATADGRAYVSYTSGSTGRPKGVQIGHRALTNFLSSMVREPGMSNVDTMFAVTTVCSDIAALELFGPLIAGGLVRLVPAETARDGYALLELIRRTRPTLLQATPVTWRMLIAAGWRGSPGLRVLCGGEVLTRDLADALLERTCEVWNLYGPTETTIWSSVGRVARGKDITLGSPVANTRLYVLDRYLQPVPDGIPGELCIGGDGVADGYLHRPELSADRFRPDPLQPGGKLYRTGDLVRRNARGELEFLGRNDSRPRAEAEDYLCPLFAANLGRRGCGADDDHFALSGDSPRAGGPVAAARAESRAESIEFTVTGGLDLAAEVTLPMHEPSSGTGGEVLLTGATGFVGAFLLRELAALPGARVTCLVRPSATADGTTLETRLRRNLGRYGLDLPPGVQVIRGDLAEPGFGLDAKEWARLAGGTGTIVHAGASVHLLRPYRELAAVNVAGTREVLRLAAESGAVMHHLSSMGVFGHAQQATARRPVTAVPGPPQRLVNGYQQSKWVAEGIAALAAERGTALAVHRVARVSGASDSGACRTDDFLWRILKGCVQAQGVPEEELEFDLVPVDAVARSIASLAGQAAEGIFHHASPAPVSFAWIAERLRDAGYRLPTLDSREWTERVAADPGNAAHALLETFAATAWGGEREILLEPGGVGENAYPCVDDAFIAKQIRFLQAIGFLPHPLR